jgi:hypothetical protein
VFDLNPPFCAECRRKELNTNKNHFERSGAFAILVNKVQDKKNLIFSFFLIFLILFFLLRKSPDDGKVENGPIRKALGIEKTFSQRQQSPFQFSSKKR